MNESLRRALLQARLSEEDVAAQLKIDPKTVRRWIEGRVPYLRHRWALAALLGVGEEDLWPQLRAGASMPDEVLGIYPHLSAVPREEWLRLFGSAKREIDVLAGSGDGVIDDTGVVAKLVRQARAGVTVRVCLMNAAAGAARRAEGVMTAGCESLLLGGALRAGGSLQIREASGVLYASMYRVDEDLLVGQSAYGVPRVQAPALHLRMGEGGVMAAVHVQTFERIWVGRRQLG